MSEIFYIIIVFCKIIIKLEEQQQTRFFRIIKLTSIGCGSNEYHAGEKQNSGSHDELKKAENLI